MKISDHFVEEDEGNMDDNYDNGDSYADVNGSFTNSPATNFPE